MQQRVKNTRKSQADAEAEDLADLGLALELSRASHVADQKTAAATAAAAAASGGGGDGDAGAWGASAGVAATAAAAPEVDLLGLMGGEESGPGGGPEEGGGGFQTGPTLEYVIYIYM